MCHKLGGMATQGGERRNNISQAGGNGYTGRRKEKQYITSWGEWLHGGGGGGGGGGGLPKIQDLLSVSQGQDRGSKLKYML